MLFSTVLVWLLVAIGFVVALPALWLLGRGLWPHKIQKQRTAADRGLFACFFLGLIPGGILVLLVAILSKVPQMGAVSVLFGGLILTWGFLGAGGIAALIGERLWPHLTSSQPWRQTMRGGFILTGSALLPVVGWVVLLPLIAILGWGIHLRSWFIKEEALPSAATLPPSLPTSVPVVQS